MTVEPPRLEMTLTLVLAGEIDSYTAPELADLLAKHQGVDAVDLRDVTFIDSSGLRVSWRPTSVGPRKSGCSCCGPPARPSSACSRSAASPVTSPWPTDGRRGASSASLPSSSSS